MRTFKGFLALIIVQFAHCITYSVTPEDDCCLNGTMCRDDCYTLQYHLLSFSNDVQMNLHCGVHYLYTNLSIQNFYNVSLVGTGGVANIECVRPSLYIILQNNTKLTIKNIKITNCGFEKLRGNFAALHDYDFCTVYLDHCKDVVIENLIIVPNNSRDCFGSVNTFGHSVFNNVKSIQLLITYNDDKINKIFINETFSVHVTISNYKHFYVSNNYLNSKGIIEMYQTTYKVHLKIINTKLCEYHILPFLIQVSGYSAANTVEIKECVCTGQYFPTKNLQLFTIETTYEMFYSNNTEKIWGNNTVKLTNCYFENININGGKIFILIKQTLLIKNRTNFNAKISMLYKLE